MSTRSSQPHRLFLPVVTPTSFPRVWRSSPTSWRQQGEHRHSWVSGVHKVRRFFFGVYLERRFNKFASVSVLSRGRWEILRLTSLVYCHFFFAAVKRNLHWVALFEKKVTFLQHIKSVHKSESCLYVTRRCTLHRAFSYVVLLWGEGANADSGCVRLDNPVNLADVLRGHAQSCAHAAHGAVGRSHKRVRPCNGGE